MSLVSGSFLWQAFLLHMYDRMEEPGLHCPNEQPHLRPVHKKKHGKDINKAFFQTSIFAIIPLGVEKKFFFFFETCEASVINMNTFI